MIKERGKKNPDISAKFTVPVFSGPYVYAEIIKISRKIILILDTIQIYLQQWAPLFSIDKLLWKLFNKFA